MKTIKIVTTDQGRDNMERVLERFIIWHINECKALEECEEYTALMTLFTAVKKAKP